MKACNKGMMDNNCNNIKIRKLSTHAGPKTKNCELFKDNEIKEHEYIFKPKQIIFNVH